MNISDVNNIEVKNLTDNDIDMKKKNDNYYNRVQY
jgi:D-hexose-6-phosphate mutarotase